MVEVGLYYLYHITNSSSYLIASAVAVVFLIQLYISFFFKEKIAIFLTSVFVIFFFGLYVKIITFVAVFHFLVFLIFTISLFFDRKIEFDNQSIASGILGLVFVTALFLSVPKGSFINIDNGKKETKSLVVDFGCPHCITELKEINNKYNLKLKVVVFTRNQVPNYYFFCSLNKKEALKEIINGNYDLINIAKCNLLHISDLLIKNTREVISKGVYTIPYTF